MSSRTQTVRGSKSTSQRGGGRWKRNVRTHISDFAGENIDDNNPQKQNVSYNDGSGSRGHFRGSNKIARPRGNAPRGNRVGGIGENASPPNVPSSNYNSKKLPDHSQNPIFVKQLMSRFNQFLPPSNFAETETNETPPSYQPTLTYPGNEVSENRSNQNFPTNNNSFGNSFNPEQHSRAMPNSFGDRNLTFNQKQLENSAKPKADKQNIPQFENVNMQSYDKKNAFKNMSENDHTSTSVNNFFQNFKFSQNSAIQENDSQKIPTSEPNTKKKANQFKTSETKPASKPLPTSYKTKESRRELLEQYGFFPKGTENTLPKPEVSKEKNMKYNNPTGSSTVPNFFSHLSEFESQTSANKETHTKPVAELGKKVSGSPKSSTTVNKEKGSHPILAGILRHVEEFNTDLINEQKNSAQRNLATRNLEGKLPQNSPAAVFDHHSFDSIAGNHLNINRKVNDHNERTLSRTEAINRKQEDYQIKQVEHLVKTKEKEEKKRQEYLNRYKHVDQGHRLYEPYLEEAAGFDAEFLLTEEEARFRQQEQLAREAEIYREKQREREEQEREREEKKMKQRMEKHRFLDAGYKLGRGSGGPVKHTVHVNHTPYGDTIKPSVIKETQKMPLKPNYREDDLPINPEDFVLEGQTYEEALELQQQLLLAAARFKPEIKEEKRPPVESYQTSRVKADFPKPKPTEQSFVKKEIVHVPVNRETCSDMLRRIGDIANQTDRQSEHRKDVTQANNENKIGKEQVAALKNAYQPRSHLTDKFFSNIDTLEKTKSSQFNKPATDQKSSDMICEKRKNPNIQEAGNSSPKLPVYNLTKDIKEPEKIKLQEKPCENKSYKHFENLSVKDLENLIFKQKPCENNSQTQFHKANASHNAHPACAPVGKAPFITKPQDKQSFKPVESPRSLIVKSSPRGPPTLLIRESEQALDQAVQRRINEIDKYGLIISSKSVETQVTPQPLPITPASTLEELGKATGAIPKFSSRAPAVVPSINKTVTSNIPAKVEPDDSPPIVNYQAEMRAVRKRMQEEYELSLKQIKNKDENTPQ